MSNTLIASSKTNFREFCQNMPQQLGEMTQDQLYQALAISGNCPTKKEVLEMRRYFFTKQKNNRMISDSYETSVNQVFALAAAFREKYPRVTYINTADHKPQLLTHSLKERTYHILLQIQQNNR